jgi:hypothetical protein
MPFKKNATNSRKRVHAKARQPPEPGPVLKGIVARDIRRMAAGVRTGTLKKEAPNPLDPSGKRTDPEIARIARRDVALANFFQILFRKRGKK